MVNAIKELLLRFPQWGQQSLQVDEKCPQVHTCQLFPQGMTVLERRENLLGEPTFRLRQSFLLRRVACTGEKAAQWVLQLQNWLLTQPVRELEAVFGPQLRLWATAGKVTGLSQPGTGIYEVKIYAEYQKE